MEAIAGGRYSTLKRDGPNAMGLFPRVLKASGVFFRSKISNSETFAILRKEKYLSIHKTYCQMRKERKSRKYQGTMNAKRYLNKDI